VLGMLHRGKKKENLSPCPTSQDIKTGGVQKIFSTCSEDASGGDFKAPHFGGNGEESFQRVADGSPSTPRY